MSAVAYDVLGIERVTAAYGSIRGDQTPVTIFQGRPGSLMRVTALHWRAFVAGIVAPNASWMVSYQDRGGVTMFELVPEFSSSNPSGPADTGSVENFCLYASLYEEASTKEDPGGRSYEDIPLPDVWLPEQSQVVIDLQLAKSASMTLSQITMRAEYL